MALQEDLSEFVASLNAKNVEYVIVGAYAMAHHGYPRYTGDLGILIRPSSENAERLMAVLDEFGFGATGLTTADFTGDDNVIQLGVPPNRIDLITSLTGVSFDEVWADRVTGLLDDLTVPYIGKACLRRNKEATGRPRDIEDLEFLR